MNFCIFKYVYNVYIHNTHVIGMIAITTLWDHKQPATTVFVLFQIPENFGGVRMLNQGKGGMVLVGTTRNCILQGTVDLQLNPIVQVGHSSKTFSCIILVYAINHEGFHI